MIRPPGRFLPIPSPPCRSLNVRLYPAGMIEYDSWPPTVRSLLAPAGPNCPFLVTAWSDTANQTTRAFNRQPPAAAATPFIP